MTTWSLIFRSGFAAKHLPFPKALRVAVKAGEAKMEFNPDGSVYFIIAPWCRDKLSVTAAIRRRNQWQMRIAKVEGAIVGILGAIAFSEALDICVSFLR